MLRWKRYTIDLIMCYSLIITYRIRKIRLWNGKGVYLEKIYGKVYAMGWRKERRKRGAMRKEEKVKLGLNFFFLLKVRGLCMSNVWQKYETSFYLAISQFREKRGVEGKGRRSNRTESISSSLVAVASRVFSALLGLVDWSAYLSPSFSKNDSNENTLHASNTGRVNNVI